MSEVSSGKGTVGAAGTEDHPAAGSVPRVKALGSVGIDLLERAGLTGGQIKEHQLAFFVRQREGSVIQLDVDQKPPVGRDAGMNVTLTGHLGVEDGGGSRKASLFAVEIHLH